MIAAGLVSLAVWGATLPEVACPADVIDIQELQQAVEREVRHPARFRARCQEPRPGKPEIVFSTKDGWSYRVELSDVVRPLRPRTAALALEMALRAPTPEIGVPAASSTGRPALADSPWALQLDVEFAWMDIGHAYVGGRLSRAFEVFEVTASGRPFTVALVLSLSAMGTDAPNSRGTPVDNLEFSLWGRLGMTGYGNIQTDLRLGFEVLGGGGADFYGNGTDGYGLIHVGAVFGWTINRHAELVVRAGLLMQFPTGRDPRDINLGFGGSVGFNIPFFGP